MLDAASVAAMDLAELTTLRLGGPARAVIDATSEQQLLDAVRVADEAGDPILVVAGGSNLVVADEGVPGTVIRVLTRGVEVDSDACSGAMVTVAAGEPWDGIVALAVDEGWVGIEALSGIPGSAGATPIQNVGAYGQEVGQTIATVRAYDRFERKVRTIHAVDCGVRLPHQPLQGRAAALARPVGGLSVPARRAQCADRVRRAGPHAGRRDRPARSCSRGPRGRAVAASRQGHGARPRRPRHLECRLVLHQPVADARPGRRSCRPRRPGSRSRTARSRPVPRG